MPNTSAHLKGSLFPLSVLQLQDNDLDKLGKQLENKIKQAPAFFSKAPLVVNIESVKDAQIDFKKLKEKIEINDFVFVGIHNGSTEQKKLAREAGLASLNASSSDSKSKKIQNDSTTGLNGSNQDDKLPTKVIKQNVRSGQQIYAQGSDLVVFGSVGHGAEVIADGDIHIYGKLRGRAIAGAKGCKSAIIICQSLEPELVSIAGNYWLSETIQTHCWQEAGLIKLDKEQLLIESLSSHI